MGRKKRNFVILGLGSFGSVVAGTLAQFGNHVLGIDSDERRVADMAEKLSNVAILDASDDAALREAGVENYNVALVSMGNDLESSILSVMNLKLIGVETIWVKADNRTHHRIMSKMGVDRVLLPDIEMGRHTAQMMNNPAVQDYVSLGNGYNVVNVRVPEELDGRTIADLRLGQGIRALGMMRGTEYIQTDPDKRLKIGDRLLLLGRKPELSQFSETL
ncbi:potassium channel family protein [Paracoccus fistulariae]|uniref:TrkA family potassium uptake protein n=1 Tax=Paracoccus fistulariae TaxID=658446 RepID=A0ABY7SM36_9RHOB|nr:TrkA family potassium uptake protein [Paracoccus fistulariae]MDB6179978.1 TrkA family potassium uptake protein [Paracoccus fistulariae]WCR08071.1 TrkA family potassium uptake protein [Paracoccus fistulariae]